MESSYIIGGSIIRTWVPPPHWLIQMWCWLCNPKGTHHLVLARLVIPLYGGFQPSNYSSKYAPWMPGA